MAGNIAPRSSSWGRTRDHYKVPSIITKRGTVRAVFVILYITCKMMWLWDTLLVMDISWLVSIRVGVANIFSFISLSSSALRNRVDRRWWWRPIIEQIEKLICVLELGIYSYHLPNHFFFFLMFLGVFHNFIPLLWNVVFPTVFQNVVPWWLI